MISLFLYINVMGTDIKQYGGIRMKKALSILLILMMVLTFVACDANSEVTNNEVTNNEETNEVVNEPEVSTFTPVVVMDGMDREITIESEPMRVITMAPSMTEMMYALGLGDRLVGRTDYCNFPAEVLEVDSIGSLREPNVEAIIALNPDLIIMSTHASEEVVAKLEEANLTVAVITAQESFDGIYEITEKMGKIFNVNEAATALIDSMKADVEEILTLVENVEKKSVYYVVGYGEYGDYTATGDTFIHNMLEMAGGTNIASDGEFWSYNLESIIEKDPEFIICSELNETKTDLETTEGYMELTAVKEGRLVEINQDLLSRQGPRLAEGLKAIAQLLHPDLFE